MRGRQFTCAACMPWAQGTMYITDSNHFHHATTEAFYLEGF
jgi:hypothetical protein